MLNWKKIGSACLLLALSGVAVAASSRALQPHTRSSLDAGNTPYTATLLSPLWDQMEEFSPFFVGTSLVSIGAVLRRRKKSGEAKRLH